MKIILESAWKSESTFGSVLNADVDDYKGVGYHLLKVLFMILVEINTKSVFIDV